MSLRQILASRFGHFATVPSAATADDGGDDDEAARAAAAQAEEDEAARKAEEEEKARKARRARKSRRAARDENNDDDDADNADEAGDDDAGDDDDADMRKAAAAGQTFGLEAAFRSGARAQRRRCAAIFAHPAAAASPVLAMSLAFETSMTSGAAIGVLEKTPAPRGGQSLHQRMAGSGAAAIRVPAGAPEGPRGQAAIAASWDMAMKAVAPAR